MHIRMYFLHYKYVRNEDKSFMKWYLSLQLELYLTIFVSISIFKILFIATKLIS